MLSIAKLNGLPGLPFAHRLDDARSGLADALAIARDGDEYWTATILFGLGIRIFSCWLYRS